MSVPLLRGMGEWSSWQPLEGSHRGLGLPRAPGLYRIRVRGHDGLAYIGQTGNIHQRMGALNVLYQPEMPYNDPHTAAPCLWVLRTQEAAEFDVSAAVVSGDVQWRKSCEAVAVSAHREAFGLSPTANFGRMPPGWTKSSGRNSRLAASGRQKRGHADTSAAKTSDHPCVVDRHRNVLAQDWCGLSWSDWSEIDRAPRGRGIYRIRRARDSGLLYVGQGVIAQRLAAHAAKASLLDHRQGSLLGGRLEASWVALPDLESQQLLEVENDVIASHILTVGVAPAAQFLG